MRSSNASHLIWRNQSSTTSEEEEILTITEDEFDTYERRGYFEGMEYRWTMKGGMYTVYIPRQFYKEVMMKIESFGELDLKSFLILREYLFTALRFMMRLFEYQMFSFI